MTEGLSFFKAYEGDIIIPCDTGIEVQSREGIQVTPTNLRKINHQIERHRCFPSGAIIGYDTVWAEGKMGIMEKKFLKKRTFLSRNSPCPTCQSLHAGG